MSPVLRLRRPRRFCGAHVAGRFSRADNDPLNFTDPLGLSRVRDGDVSCPPPSSVVEGVCVDWEAIERAADNPPSFPKKEGGYIVGLCGQSQVGFVIFWGQGGCLIDDGQHLAVTATLYPGGGTPGASLTGGVLVSNGDHVNDIKGAFLCAGVGASGVVVAGGLDICVSPDTDTWTAYAGLGVGLEGIPFLLPVEAHFSASYTWVWTVWNHGDWQAWLEDQVANAATSTYDHDCDVYDWLGGDFCDPTQVFGG